MVSSHCQLGLAQCFFEGRQRSAFATCHRYDSQLHWLPGSNWVSSRNSRKATDPNGQSIWVTHGHPKRNVHKVVPPSGLGRFITLINYSSFTGLLFGAFFIFPYIGNSNPNWLIFFRGVKTTNQLCLWPVSLRTINWGFIHADAAGHGFRINAGPVHASRHWKIQSWPRHFNGKIMKHPLQMMF